MKTFEVRFKGRKNGAIGITYPMVVTITVDDESHIEGALYRDYEHISGIKILKEIASQTVKEHLTN